LQAKMKPEPILPIIILAAFPLILVLLSLGPRIHWGAEEDMKILLILAMLPVTAAATIWIRQYWSNRRSGIMKGTSWFKKKPSWEEHYAQTIYDGLVASGGPGDITALKLRTTMLPDVIKAALLEELRFAKRQQWTITAAVVGLIAGAYTIAVEKQSTIKIAATACSVSGPLITRL